MCKNSLPSLTIETNENGNLTKGGESFLLTLIVLDLSASFIHCSPDLLVKDKKPNDCKLWTVLMEMKIAS